MARDRAAIKETTTAQRSQGVDIRSEARAELHRELVAHLRENRTLLREEWLVRYAIRTGVTQA
jgi:hypothetical protein